MTVKAGDDFMKILEDGVRAVLTEKKSTAKDKIDAINAGTKLMQIKHKINESDGSSESFFNK